MYLILLFADLALAVSLALLSASSCSVKSINIQLEKTFAEHDIKMEAFPFKIGDYNRDVQANYPSEKGVGMSLKYADDAIAYIVIYSGEVYSGDTAAEELEKEYTRMQKHYSGECFNQSSMHYIDANEMHTVSGGLRLPVIHVSTAGHASGGAFYYQRQHVTNEPDEWAGKTIYGTSVHKEYGTDTRFAGVIVFEELRDVNFVPRVAVDVAQNDDARIRILNTYNTIG